MLSRFIAKVEKIEAGFGMWIAGFVGIIFIRFFLENLSSPTRSFPAAPDMLTLVHYGLFYLAALLLVSLIIRIFVPDISAISKFLIVIFPISWLPPIIDLIASRGMGSLMAYVFAPRSELLQSFFTIGGSYALGGITLGIKIELAIILCGVFAYVFAKTKNIVKTIAATALVYIGIFFLIALPSFLVINSPVPSSAILSLAANSHLMNNFARPTLQYSYAYAIETLFNLSMAQVLYLLCFAFIVIWSFAYRPRMALAFLKNIRPGRMIHFVITIALGAIFGAAMSGVAVFNNIFDVLAFINIMIVFVCAWLFAVGVNDLADVRIDSVSNSGRPLVAGNLSEQDVRNGNLFFLVWLLVGAYIAGFWTFFTAATFTAAYYVYSASPTRLKQVPILATFIMSIATLSAILAGFYFSSASKLLAAFPSQLMLLVLIFFTLMFNVKDMKDIDGDRADGIITIPVAFPRYGKEIVGGLFAVAFLAVPVITGVKILFIPSVIAAIIGYTLINLKHYREWPIFVLYFVYIATAAGLLWPR